jgi:PAS domain S-box-containing protein
MAQKWNGIERRKSLRTNAEAMVINLSPAETSAHPNEKLLHELLVHKIELEMQNEELRKTYCALEEALERYRDLYDFAPVGYISVDGEDSISEINLTGAEILGITRDQLTHLRFSKFVAAESRDRWYCQLRNLMDASQAERQSFVFELQRADGSLFQARLTCQRKEGPEASPMLRIALADIGQIDTTTKN